MSNKGQVETAVLFGLIVVLLVGGLFGAGKIISENRYVGDIESSLVYDLKYCDIKEISDNKLIDFQNKEEAYIRGFKDAKCNQ